MDRETVLILTHSEFPFGGPSANFLRYLARGLAEQSVCVDVLLQRGTLQVDDSREALPEKLNYRHLTFSRRPSNGLLRFLDTSLGALLPFFVILFGHTSKYHTLFIYNRSAFETVPAMVAAKLRGLPTCNIVVEWYERKTLVRKRLHILRWFDFLVNMKYVHRWADSLIVLTTYLEQYYHREGYPAHRILLIPNLSDTSPDLGGTDCMQTRYPRRRARRIGYCGSPTEKDGLDDLLAAMALLARERDDVELLVLGDIPGPQSVIPALRQRADDLNIADRVLFPGLVPFEDVAPILNTCDVLVLARPSGTASEAGFPTKLGEYMACSKPIVLTKVGDFPRYFSQGSDVALVDPGDAKSLAAEISSILDDDRKAHELGEKGHRWGQQNLDFRLNTATILRFIRDVQSTRPKVS